MPVRTPATDDRVHHSQTTPPQWRATTRRTQARWTNLMDHTPGRAFPFTRVPRFDFDTDVIVVGFGAAGACAAIEAARAGARVTLLEVAAGGGGTSALSGGES